MCAPFCARTATSCGASRRGCAAARCWRWSTTQTPRRAGTTASRRNTAGPGPRDAPSPTRWPRARCAGAADFEERAVTDAIERVLGEIRFGPDGLVLAIAQQHDTGEVLMMAWMNRDAV